jgi:hypothetical protein
VLAWLYTDTRDAKQVAQLSLDIFWFVLGGLPFFVVLAVALRSGWNVFVSFGSAALAGFAGVALTQWLLARFTTGG